jgi:parvulin-like peptidyl-prolyl isomerase
VLGLVGYAIYDYAFVRPNLAVVTIDGEEVTSQEFAGWTRMVQADLVNQIEYISISAQYGMIGPDQMPQVQQQIEAMSAQLENEITTAQIALDRLVETHLIQQKLEELGIELDEAEIERQIELGFNYIAEGTPTALPSLTPDVERTRIYSTAFAAQGWATATITPTRTATSEMTAPTEGAPATLNGTQADPQATADIVTTPAGSPTPRPTATEFTQEGYEQLYDDTIRDWEDLGVPEEVFRIHLLRSYYTEQLIEYFTTQVEDEAEQVLLSHILVADEETAETVLQSLENGRSWESLAVEYSMDFNTSFYGGDIGWNTLEGLAERYTYNVGIAAFAAEPDAIVGPIPADDGLHLFWVMGRETRSLSPEQLDAAAQIEYNNWLAEARQTVEVEVLSDLAQWVPSYLPLVRQ